jgi:hypothetical protein
VVNMVNHHGSYDDLVIVYFEVSVFMIIMC